MIQKGFAISKIEGVRENVFASALSAASTTKSKVGRIARFLSCAYRTYIVRLNVYFIHFFCEGFVQENGSDSGEEGRQTRLE